MASFHSVSCQLPEGETCTICRDGFPLSMKEEDLPYQHSGRNGTLHTFHYDCIRRWVTEVPRCPVCKVGVEKDSLMSRGERIRKIALKTIAIGVAMLGCSLLADADIRETIVTNVTTYLPKIISSMSSQLAVIAKGFYTSDLTFRNF